LIARYNYKEDVYRRKDINVDDHCRSYRHIIMDQTWTLKG